MSQKHIIEIRGGPFDGALLDLADTVYKAPEERMPWEPSLTFFGIPVFADDDGRRFVRWSDVDLRSDVVRLEDVERFIEALRDKP